MLGADQPVNLHLLEITAALPGLGGVVMELADCAFPTLNKIVATDDARVGTIDLAMWAPGPIELRIAPDGRTAVVSVGPGFFTGSGGSLVGAARDAGADAYVTGDLKYHDFDAAEGMGLVNLPHAAMEALFATEPPRIEESGT